MSEEKKFFEVNKKVKDLLLNGKKEIVDFDAPLDIIVFSNDYLLASFKTYLKLYDKSLNMVRKIEEINGEEYCPAGIALNDDDKVLKNTKLYICDTKNKRIQILTRELQFLNPLKVDYYPFMVRLSDQVLCFAAGFDSSGVYFYNFDDLKLQKVFNHGTCRISEINSIFYEFNHKAKKFFCYDKNGKLEEEVTLIWC